MNPFLSLRDYEEFIYTLPQKYESVRTTSLVLVRRGSTQARVSGTVTFAQDYQLVIRERLTTENGSVEIQRYSYEGWRNQELLYWYDSQPHPDNPDLAPNHPHHKHIHPNIKRNRVVALDLSFERANLPFLIGEVEKKFFTDSGDSEFF